MCKDRRVYVDCSDLVIYRVFMPTLKDLKLGTDMEEGWWCYELHATGVYLIDELFLCTRYVGMIRKKEEGFENLSRLYSGRVNSDPAIKALLNFTKAESDWARQQRDEGYHLTYSHAMVSEWAAFEAGIERQLVRLIEKDHSFASAALRSIGKPVKDIDMTGWPWDEKRRHYLYDRLERKPQRASFAERHVTLCRYLAIDVVLNENTRTLLDEANAIRNALMHSRGEITEDDVSKVPSLIHWVGKKVALNDNSFGKYHEAIVSTLLATLAGIDACISSRKA
jgi:hypothetical protein